MSEKPKPNGHDKEAEPPHVETPAGTRYSRTYRARKKAGVVLLKHVPVAPDMISALIQNGWLHESEKYNREAILAAIGALLFRALEAGVTPGTKALLEIERGAIEDALPWLPAGTPLTAVSAAKALQAVSRCSAIAGFTPEVYTARLKQHMAEIQARGVVKFPELTH